MDHYRKLESVYSPKPATVSRSARKSLVGYLIVVDLYMTL